MPVSFSVNRLTALHTDNDGDGFADAGDVLRHTLTFTNTSNIDALNVVVNDLLGGSTQTVLMNISPIAFNDTFTAVGNTMLLVGGATNPGTGPASIVSGNLLSNDVGSTTVGVGALAGDDVTGFTIVNTGTQGTTDGGSVTINADGSFSYISGAGDTGTDTFSYTIRDFGIDGVAGGGDDTDSTATVTITLSGQVWYVDSAAAGGGTGTSTNPFNSITALNTANVDGANDYVYVKGNATGQLVMETGEHLIGTGASLDVATFHLADAGARSTITNNAAGFTVTLAGGGTGNNEIAGINIVSTGGTGNHGLTGTNFGTLTIGNTTIDASGQGLILSTGAIAGTGLVSTDSDGGANNVSLTAITGSLALGTGALAGATGTAFNVSGGTVSTTYSGNISQATAGQALVSVAGGHGTGTLTFTGTLSATNGTGLQFNDADGTYNFNGTNTMNGGDAGVDITNGSNGNFSFSASSSITNPSGVGFNVNGGTGNIDYNGTLSKTSDGRVIDFQNHTGGTVSFDGTVSSTSLSDGINLATNTGAVISFTNTLSINTSSSGTTGFGATGGGTVSASGANSTINSGAGTALNVSNTNIGAADMIFQSISSSGGTATGIILDTTGSAGGLHVLGTGSAGSGGTIASKTGADGSTTTGIGIYLNSTSEVQLDRMQLNNFENFGIRGYNVNGFTLANSTVNTTSGFNGTTDASDEGSVAFGDFNNASLSGLTGTVNITNSVIANSFENNFRVVNHSGSMTFNMSGSTVRDTRTVSPGNEGLLLQAEGSANMTIDIENSSFLRNRANGVHVINQSTGTVGVNIGNAGQAGSGGTFTDNTIGVNLNQNDSGTLNFNVLNATFTVPNFPGLYGAGGASSQININMGGAASPVQRGAFTGNVIGNSINMNNSLTGPGMRIVAVGTDTDGGNVLTVKVDSNTVSAVANFGIQVQSGDGNATVNATIINNTVTTVTNAGLEAIRVDAGVTSSQAGAPGTPDNGTINLDIRNNTTTVDPAAGVSDIRIRQRFNTTFRLEGYGGSATNDAAVVTYVQGQNGGNSVSADHNNTGFQTIVNVTEPPAPLMASSTPPLAESILEDKPTGNGTGGELPPPVTPDPATPGPVTPTSNPPAVVDDGVLSQAELNLIVNAAIDRWAAAGATAEQIAAMHAVTVSVEDLAGLSLGSSEAGHIEIDSNGAGFSWFVDATPGDDSEYSGTGTRLTAPGNSQAGTRMDLLTTVMHELGHQIGLSDDYSAGDRDELMYGSINPGERRLPGHDDLSDASGAPVAGTAFILSPVNIGTVQGDLLNPRTVTVQWDSTVDAFVNQVVPTFNNSGTISGSNVPVVPGNTSNVEVLGPTGTPTPTFVVLDSLTLGGTIWNDNGAGGGIAGNGLRDGTEAGIDNVILSLFVDANNDNSPDTPATSIATATSAGGGTYAFNNLAPGNYIVRVDQDNFDAGGASTALVATPISPVTSPEPPDPDGAPDVDNDDNGSRTAGQPAFSQTITIAHDSETTLDASGHLDINTRLDFGFFANVPPVVTATGGTTAFDEGVNIASTPVAIDTGLTLSDVDDSAFSTGTVSITTNFQAGEDLLAFTANVGLYGDIDVVSYAGGVLSLSSPSGTATVAQWQAALRSVTYSNSSQDPNTAMRTLSFQVNDGDDNSNAGTQNVSVAAHNDEPILTATGADPTYAEDGAGVDLFTTVSASTVEPLQTLTSMTLTVTNVTDGASEVLFFDGSNVALTDGNTVPNTATNNLSVSVAVLGTTATVTFSLATLSEAALATLVDSLTYTNTSQNPTDGNRVVTITQLVDSGSNAGPDDNIAAPGLASTVNVDPSNDAASITGDVTGDVTEASGTANGTAGTSPVIGDLGSTDVDNTNDAWQAVAAGAASVSGYGTYGIDAAGNWTYTVDENDPAVEALNTGGTLSDTFDALTEDNTLQTVTITIHGADDFPVAQPDALTTDEATMISGSVFDAHGSGVDNDVDDPTLTVDQVNGSSGDVGMSIGLVSGATLKLNMDGTFDYTPFPAFDTTPTLGSGASNTPAHDSFTYRLTNGNTVTVNITITGLDSNDHLFGAVGADALAGGIGNDRYFIDEAIDVVTEAVGEGTDRILTSVSYVLAAGSELEVLSTSDNLATTAIDLTGNELGSYLFGNAGTNKIDGKGGADVMVGLDGNDRYYVDVAGDRIVELAGGGTDRVLSAVSWTLEPGSQVEIMTTTDNLGMAAINLTGNDYGQYLFGNAGANRLDGGGGGDVMLGLEGNDIYLTRNAADRVVEATGGGSDRVFAGANFVLDPGSEVEILSTIDILGSAAIDITGNELGQYLFGNQGANTLDGKLGKDVLIGSGGADIFQFTTVPGANNFDRITDFQPGVDKIALNDFTFPAVGAPGPLNPNAFYAGAAAHDADDRIIYNQATGGVYYDFDGNGVHAAVLFAILDTKPVITDLDFTVI